MIMRNGEWDLGGRKEKGERGRGRDGIHLDLDK